MSRNVSPFSQLSGEQKQIRWLEYQTIRLPYLNTAIDQSEQMIDSEEIQKNTKSGEALPHFQKINDTAIIHKKLYAEELSQNRHSNYNAVIARLKKAELHAKP